MKIIHVISGLSKGGGERIAVELSNQAVNNGDKVVIVAGWPENPDFLQNSINPQVEIKFVAKKKSTAFLNILFWVLKNRKWIVTYDILHCHLTFGAVFGSITQVILKNILQKKRPFIIETNHSVGMSIPKLSRWLQAMMLSQRDGIILMAKDPYWTKFMTNHPRLKSKIIANGISIPVAPQSEKTEQTFNVTISPSCKYLVGTVSMLRPDRKPWLYIPIFKSVYEALGDAVHFVIAGGGIESSTIKTLIEEQGLSNNVSMPGIVNNPTSLISHMDMYVSVSVGATGGISMIEAAMCNTPVIAIQLTENYKTKNQDWFWSHTDINEVAKKIIFLLQNDEKRNELIRNQNKFVNKHLTTEAMHSSYHSFYEELLQP